jgi:hypothetical protein
MLVAAAAAAAAVPVGQGLDVEHGGDGALG